MKVGAEVHGGVVGKWLAGREGREEEEEEVDVDGAG